MSNKPTKEQIRKRIRDRNYRFRKMTPEQQRVRIARDVIDQLEAGALVAQQGTYLAVDDRDDLHPAILLEEAEDLRDRADSVYGYMDAQERSNARRRAARLEAKAERVGAEQLCDALEGVTCTVCGIGAAFVAAVKRGDDFKVNDFTNGFGDDDAMRDYLRKYFTANDVALIECAFERSPGFAHYGGSTLDETSPQVIRAVAFGNGYPDSSSDRLRAIMQNIINNGGAFRP